MAAQEKVAVAFFVRTPGMSEAKSRLADQIGTQTAAEIYELSLARCKELADGLSEWGAEVIWAVAEREGVGSDYWRNTGHEAVLSGEGDLGTCLANVYGQLRKRAPTAMLLGSDSPQLMLGDLQAACGDLDGSPIVVGPATDGGFYLFAGRSDIEPEVWQSVEYSAPTTLNQLEIALGRPLHRMSKLTDFDDLESLLQVVKEMPSAMSPAQSGFVDLARTTLKEMRYCS